ncbi:exported hypothetical protein [Vibrio coralliirubri]|uniref:hypothetical protein n=1 Tax=Vibrio coralliirubri TaxID=1516159 RepID=UPI000636E679|nr:hypothetical protein [Vibrio coralliirubri]CDT53991.1 exported hypothetical protein [Vibrio coralliirubri]
MNIQKTVRIIAISLIAQLVTFGLGALGDTKRSAVAIGSIICALTFIWLHRVWKDNGS